MLKRSGYITVQVSHGTKIQNTVKQKKITEK